MRKIGRTGGKKEDDKRERGKVRKIGRTGGKNVKRERGQERRNGNEREYITHQANSQC